MKYSTFFDIMIIDYRGRLIMEYIIEVKNLEKKYGNFKALNNLNIHIENMYDKSQLMKGTLEGCILQILSETVTYGYEIVTTLTEFGFEDVKEGSIYPLLVRLEKKGMISSELRPSPLGPKRKYYSLTAEGEAYLQEFIKCWTEVQLSVNRILKKEE